MNFIVGVYKRSIKLYIIISSLNAAAIASLYRARWRELFCSCYHKNTLNGNSKKNMFSSLRNASFETTFIIVAEPKRAQLVITKGL